MRVVSDIDLCTDPTRQYPVPENLKSDPTLKLFTNPHLFPKHFGFVVLKDGMEKLVWEEGWIEFWGDFGFLLWRDRDFLARIVGNVFIVPFCGCNNRSIVVGKGIIWVKRSFLTAWL